MLMVTYSDKWISRRLLELAGLRNAVDSFEGFKPLSPEVVLEAQPDLILSPAKGAKSLGGDDAVMGLKGVSDTDAARQGRLITIDDLALLGFGPRFPHALKELQEKSQALMLEKEKGSRSP